MRLVLLLVLSLVGCCTAFKQEYPDFGWEEETALDEYVNFDDGAWNYTILNRYRYGDSDIYMVNMTSQKWLDDDTVDHSVWWHWMGIAVPHVILHPEHALVVSMGGPSNRNKEDYPGRFGLENLVLSKLATDTNTVCAYVMEQPNGPIRFLDDPANKGRSGDDLIAYSWAWYIEKFRAGLNPKPEAILRFPMTKAAKRAFDTVIAVAEEVRPGETNIDKCVASGASKRGWTAWSHAYTDRRVVASIPLVFSLLKVEETMMSHYRALGGAWSFAMRPYYNNNLTKAILDDDANEVLDYEDPFRYRSRLADIPKLVINACGDEYFFAQDFHHWWSEMGGPKWLMMNPNAEHILFPHWLKVYSTMVGWYLTLVNDGVEALPVIDWIKEEEADVGRVTMTTDLPPDETRGMRAVTLPEDDIRDFRLVSGYPDPWLHPVWWRERNITALDTGVFEFEEDVVEDEWVGFLIEGTWRTEYGFDMYFTTEAHIIPDTFPVEPCTTPEECYSKLV